jgi:hypothetical protein
LDLFFVKPGEGWKLHINGFIFIDLMSIASTDILVTVLIAKEIKKMNPQTGRAFAVLVFPVAKCITPESGSFGSPLSLKFA